MRAAKKLKSGEAPSRTPTAPNAEYTSYTAVKRDMALKLRPPPADGGHMRHYRLVALLAFLVPALAACGSSGHAAGSSPSAPKTDQQVGMLPPTVLVLHTADVGQGYVVDPSATKHESLSQELQHESLAARRADRHGYLAGYTIEYVRPGHDAVLSEALTYRDARSARAVSTDRAAAAYMRRALHAHPIRIPKGAPGSPRLMMHGTVQGAPLLLYGWQHGRVLDVITVFGDRTSQARLMKLAQRQDHRLTHPTFGDA